MNLYRSFGNLMEAWVSEGGQCSDPEWPENNEEDSPTPSSDMGTNLRSESVDSGVETASSNLSFLATSCSISRDNAEIDTFTPEGEDHRLTPASTSQSPVPSLSSSSSMRLCPSRAQGGYTALSQKLEEALQRTESKHLKDKPEPITVGEVLRRQPGASFLPKRHTSELVRGQRSASFSLSRTVNPSVPTRQLCRRPMSMICNRQPAQTRLEDLGEEEGKGLSPGLCYLEQVCQMLEEIARKQMHNQALQMETNALREHQDMEALDGHQSDSKATEDVPSSCRRLEETESAEPSSSEPQQQKDYPQRHFRQRSSSDAPITTLHLRKLNSDCRGQHLSTDDLLQKTEDDHEKQECTKEKMTKTNKNWKLRFGSLGREESAGRDVKSQQMQSSERNSARRRFSQLFRRTRRKTLPV
ncbi:uncharacterized protein si:dkey-106l3.7 [Dicentrarchus labrax]|uniref:uncharacterized protein si:dkey-106l3.7 n=1 Tax=Dicentrarchus labrax TaxID=13489 RepID=UPI0021F4FF96|nr:uncharacterized protein si:dkey-106l3.7 [Dicentrarchus labrax]